MVGTSKIDEIKILRKCEGIFWCKINMRGFEEDEGGEKEAILGMKCVC